MEDLLSKLSLDEKIQLVSGASAWRTQPIPGAGVPEMKVSDGPNGVRGDGGVASASFPVGICMASTWNASLIEQVGDAIADEAKSKGVQVVLGPTINIHRGPLGGRNFECYSEDPFLSGVLASAFTDGVQARGVGACLKHYVCNDSEFERHTISIEIDDRTLREIYLRPFEITIKRSNPWTVMAAYNRINGVYACSHDYLINDVLKGEWQYDGLVISDWYAAKETVPNALGGLDLEMPGPSIVWGDKLRAAVDRGDVPESVINDKVERLLLCMSRTGLMDDVKVTNELALDKPEHRKLAYQSAVEGMVLCKNDGLLPMDLATKRRVAVIGPNAEDFRIMGGGSSSLRPHYVQAPLQRLAEAFPHLEVTTARGCATHKYIPEAPRHQLSPTEGSNEKGLSYQFYEGGLAGSIASERVVARGTIMLQGLNESKLDSLVATGYYRAEETGEHTFGIFAAGRSRIFLGDDLLVDNWNETTPGDAFFGQGTTEKRGSRHLEAGQSYPLRIEYDADQASTFKAMRFGILGPDLEQGMTRALEIASAAEAVIMIVGTNDDWETEGNDREFLGLPGEQDALIESVVALNPNTIVVNNSGSPIAMPWLERVPAMIQTWFAGQEFGNALLDLITGAANPSGKLPITFPERMVDTPAYTSYPGEFGKVHYGEGLFVGYRWYDCRQIEPLLPFGFGLSYTIFQFSDLILSESNGSIKVQLQLANSGERSGKETVQVYVEPVSPSVARPIKELKAFTKVELAAGQSTTVEIELDDDAFAHWDPDANCWRVSEGEYLIHVGNSSRHLHLSGSVQRGAD